MHFSRAIKNKTFSYQHKKLHSLVHRMCIYINDARIVLQYSVYRYITSRVKKLRDDRFYDSIKYKIFRSLLSLPLIQAEKKLSITQPYSARASRHNARNVYTYTHTSKKHSSAVVVVVRSRARGKSAPSLLRDTRRRRRRSSSGTARIRFINVLLPTLLPIYALRYARALGSR